MLVDLALVSCSFDDQYVGYSTVQNAVYGVEYGHLNSLDLARKSKTPDPGPWNSTLDS